MKVKTLKSALLCVFLTTLLIVNTHSTFLDTQNKLQTPDNQLGVRGEPCIDDPLEAWSEASYIVWKYNLTHTAARDTSTNLVSWISDNASYVIQSAIDALTNGGKIFVKAGEYDISSQVIIKTGVYIEGETSQILKGLFGMPTYFKIIQAINALVMCPGSGLSDIQFEVDWTVDFTDKNVITVNATDESISMDKTIKLHHLFGYNGHNNGTFIKLEAAANKGLYFCTFDHIVFGRFNRGIYIKTLGSGASVNNNVFNNVFGYYTPYGIVLDKTSGGNINGNVFYTYSYQGLSGNTEKAYIVDGCRNTFIAPTIWDIPAGKYAIHILSTAEDTRIIGGQHSGNKVLDEGTRTKFVRDSLYITQVSGTASGSSPIVVEHGLAGTPTVVTLGANAAQPYSLSWIANSTHITIYHSATGSLTVAWYCEYKP